MNKCIPSQPNTFVAGIMIKLILIPLFMLWSFYAKAQYTVTVSNDTYSYLSALPLPYNPQSYGYQFSPNFIFPTFNRMADFNYLPDEQSAGGFISTDGYLAVYEKPGYANTIVFQCFYDTSFNKVDGTTTVKAEMTGAKPNRIAKFEWKDLVHSGNKMERATFQIWLHEADSSVSYHFGPNSLPTASAQAYCGIVVINPDFTGVLDEINLEGNPASPAVYKGITSFAFPTLDSIPHNGTVITFKRDHTTSVKHSGSNSQILVFPNPCDDQLMIQNTFGEGTVSLYDAMGNMIMTTTLAPTQTVFSTHDIATGIYTLKIQCGNRVDIKKIIRQ